MPKYENSEKCEKTCENMKSVGNKIFFHEKEYERNITMAEYNYWITRHTNKVSTVKCYCYT